MKTPRWPDGTAESADLWFAYSREQPLIADFLPLHRAGCVNMSNEKYGSPSNDVRLPGQRADPPTLDSTRLAYLDAMGIQLWVRRSPESRSAVSEPSPSSPSLTTKAASTKVLAHVNGDVAALGWEALMQRVADCSMCELHNTRTQTVFGVGDYDADWLFVGEAPGAEEDRQGEPFVGRAGQLLTSMIRALGMRREQVYIANILKCRPPKNRDPRPQESQACRPYLRRQINLLNPKIIVALGRIAAQNLLQTDTPIGKMRGREYFYEETGIPIVVTYHPAYLLRSPQEKRKVWKDLCSATHLAKSTC